MYEAEIYLENLRKRFYPRIYTVFFITLAVFILSIAVSYLLFCKYCANLSCTVLPSGENNLLKSILVSRLPTVAAAVILILSVCTMYNRGIIVLLSLWRGISLGGFVSLASGGLIIGLSRYWVWGIALNIIESTVLLIFCAYSETYSEAVNVLRANGAGEYSSALMTEFVKCALVFGGVMILCASASELLILC